MLTDISQALRAPGQVFPLTAEVDLPEQIVLDDHAFVFCSFLKMSMISKANVKNYTSHACDYYQVTADLDVE